MDTKTTIIAAVALIAMFFGIRYYHSSSADTELVLIAQDKYVRWDTDAGGGLQYPEVAISVLDPPFDGASLQLKGIVRQQEDIAALKQWLEQEEPIFAPEEYVFDVKVEAFSDIDTKSARGTLDFESTDPGLFGLPPGKQQGAQGAGFKNPFDNLPGFDPGDARIGNSRQLGIPSMGDLEREASQHQGRTQQLRGGGLPGRGQGAFPPQQFPPQGYPPQAIPQQGYPPQQFPPQGYPPQGIPQQGYPPQGQFAPRGGYPPQAYPPQGYQAPPGYGQGIPQRPPQQQGQVPEFPPY